MAGRLHRPTGAGLPSASARSNCQRGIIMRALSISPPAAVALARYVASLILTIVAVSSVAAEDVASYPSATIRIIVPYPAGGTADALPRIIGDRLQARWNQSVIIVNRPGAGGNIGAETVAVAEPNGYTLLATPPGPLVINEALYKELTFRPSGFEPAIVMGSVPNVMDVRPGFPAKSAHDVLNYILGNPGKVTFAPRASALHHTLLAFFLKSCQILRWCMFPTADLRRHCKTLWAIALISSLTISLPPCLYT